MAKLVLLDRDGVINHDSKDYIKSPEEWQPLPGSLEAIATFKKAGWIVAVATNQSGIFRGLYSEATLTKIHEKFTKALASFHVNVDAIFYCPHGPDENCLCRKPKPGLLEQALQQFNINPQTATVPMIGDSLRDLEAATAAHCQPILVRTGNGMKTLQQHPERLKETLILDNLLQAANYLCS